MNLKGIGLFSDPPPKKQLVIILETIDVDKASAGKRIARAKTHMFCSFLRCLMLHAEWRAGYSGV